MTKKNNQNQINQLSESLMENDLKWLVLEDVMIDMHKTKLGKDSDYMVLAISVTDKKPAEDLATFIENSVYEFDDVEVSGATDTAGNYMIYVELARDDQAYKTVHGILTDCTKLCGITEWKFKTTDVKNSILLDEDSFNAHIITSPAEYISLHPEKTDEEEQADAVKESIKSRFKFLLSY